MTSMNVNENDIYIFCSNVEYLGKWKDSFESACIFDKVDEDIIYSLGSAKQNDGNKLARLIVFDNVLNSELFQKDNFKSLIETANNKKIKIIIMTNNNEIIKTKYGRNNATYTLLHSYPENFHESTEQFKNNYREIENFADNYPKYYQMCKIKSTCFTINSKERTFHSF